MKWSSVFILILIEYSFFVSGIMKLCLLWNNSVSKSDNGNANANAYIKVECWTKMSKNNRINMQLSSKLQPIGECEESTKKEFQRFQVCSTRKEKTPWNRNMMIKHSFCFWWCYLRTAAYVERQKTSVFWLITHEQFVSVFFTTNSISHHGIQTFFQVYFSRL